MTIADLLMSQRRWGVTRCRKLLQYIPMSETKEVGSMTARQRHALASCSGKRVRAPRSAPQPRASFERRLRHEGSPATGAAQRAGAPRPPDHRAERAQRAAPHPPP